jgi:uncharacterized protein (DUF362 family)
LAHVHIAPVASYEDGDGIRAFVRDTLTRLPAVQAVLHNGPAQPLVVVKPNWVQQAHETRPEVWEPVITHPAVVLAVVEELAALLADRGCIALCDSPHTYANFDAILSRGGLCDGLQAIRAAHPGVRIETIDLRRETWIARDGVVLERRPNPPDPRGYAALNLGRNSLFHGQAGEGRYYGADYDSAVVNEHHRGETQEYLLAGTPMQCDLFVNVPKLKTHKKTGLTCSLKNLVGITGDKNWLPHHTEGGPRAGGDEFPEESLAHALERVLKRFGRRMALSLPGIGPWLFHRMRQAGKQVLGDSETVVRNGNWCGNDTCWRMALDLNRALLFGNADGTWRDARRAKAYLTVVDGIIGGEGNGPLCPDPVLSGVLLGGDNPAQVDAVACKLMGFEPHAVPLVREAFAAHRWPLADAPLDTITVWDGRVGEERSLADVDIAVPGGFRPHFGWTVLNPGKT